MEARLEMKPETKSIGEHIAELRKQKNVTQSVTQEALAEAVGVTVQAFSKWENGGSPDAALLPRIADFFEVSIDSLYGRASDPPKPDTTEIMMQVRKHLASFADIAPGNWGKFGNTREVTKELFDICYGSYWLYMHPDVNQVPGRMEADVKHKLEKFAEQGHEEGGGYDLPPQKSMYGHNIVAGCRMYMDTINLPFFMLMLEPEGGWRRALPSAEEYAEFFKILSDPGMLKMLLCVMETDLSKHFSAHYLAKHSGLEQDKVQAAIDFMLEKSIITKNEHLVLDDNEMEVYSPNHNESILLPLLAMARILVYDIRLGGGNGYRWNDDDSLI